MVTIFLNKNDFILMKKNYKNILFALVCLLTWQIQSNAQTAISSEGFEVGCAALVITPTNACASTGTFGWTVDAGGTGSSNTGPSSSTEGNNYLYLETSSGSSGSISTYTMDPVVLGAPASAPFSLSFDWHMFGATMGTLDVDISDRKSVV